MMMTALEIGKVAYEANLNIIRQEMEAGISEGEPETYHMLQPWDETPKFVKEIYEQYVRLIIRQSVTSLPFEIQDLWIADQESRGWKAGEDFNYETMTNSYLVPARDWDNNARNRFFITFATANSLRRFYKEEPECYTETVQREDTKTRLDGSNSHQA